MILVLTKRGDDMARRKLSDFEKVQARADHVAKQNKQFLPVQVVAVLVEDWTDDDGKPIVTAQESGN
jgi:hypothetical protein